MIQQYKFNEHAVDIFDEMGLSNRELEVLLTQINCRTNKDIAEKLFVCEKTIKFHVGNILKKFSVGSRIELNRIFFQMKFIEICNN